MRVPPYYRDPSWQRFFAGVIIGAIIGFGFFIFINGVAQERQLQLIASQKKQIEDLQQQNNLLLDDEKKMNEDLEKKMTIQSIEISIEKKKDIKLDGIKQVYLKEQIADQLRSIIGNDIESVAKNRDLIFNAINNHSFVIEDKVYQVTVKSVTIYSDLRIQVIVQKETVK